MRQGRLAPGAIAAALGMAAFGAYVIDTGLDADIGNSGYLLAMTVAVFLAPGCAGAAFMEWRARRQAQDAAFAMLSPDVGAVAQPQAADASAEIHSLTEARVERETRARGSVDDVPETRAAQA